MECVCLCLARLVDNFHSEERILKEIAAHGLLTGIQQLVSAKQKLSQYNFKYQMGYILTSFIVHMFYEVAILLEILHDYIQNFFKIYFIIFFYFVPAATIPVFCHVFVFHFVFN